MKKFIIKNKIIFFCFFVALLTLYFCSKNSPHYPMNDWVDVNAFFTMARSWLHGIIPYKDLFEQKGPVLYLIYMIGAIITSKSFLGVFIVEVVFYTTFAYLIGKISDLYLKKEFKYIIIPLILTFIASSTAFAHGGSAEEFILPMITLFLYNILKFFKEKKLSRKNLILLGVVAGLIALTKYTLLGLPFIFMTSVFFIYVFEKEYKKAIMNCIYFLIGMSFPIIIILGYFLLTHALTEFIQEYILINIKYYGESYTLIERFEKMGKILYDIISKNQIYIYLLLITNILLLFTKVILKTIKEKIIYALMISFTVLGIYWGCKIYPYYFLEIELFLILPIIYIFKLVENKIKFNKFNKVLTIALVLIISIININSFQYKSFSKVKKKDLVQYKFAKIMNKEKNPTLLNYQVLDSGFYYMANIDPTVFAFEAQNISYYKYPYVADNQNIAILEGKIKFVMIRTSNGIKDIPEFVYDNYEIKAVEKQEFEYVNFTYILLKKIEEK